MIFSLLDAIEREAIIVFPSLETNVCARAVLNFGSILVIFGAHIVATTLVQGTD